MERKKILSLIAIVFFCFSACKDDDFVDLYERPSWLTGKIYTQMKQREALSTFARCLELTGYDTIVDVSGSYTVFAPNNSAFDAYLQSEGFNSVEDIPKKELEKLVKYHIVQNPWSKLQLQQLDIRGWIDTSDVNNDSPRGFKRQTLLRGEDYFFGIDHDDDLGFVIRDSLNSEITRRIINDTRKYAPIYYNEYFSIYDLEAADYEFYFDRAMPSKDEIYFARGMVMGEEIFADNGFIYEIDQVNDPLENAYEILNKETGEHQYSQFLELIYDFPEFEYNEEKTFDQPGAELGLEVDSLFEMEFPELSFNITNENTQPPKGTTGFTEDVSIRYHHGLIAPTNQALNSFFSDYLEGPDRWGSIEEAPNNIKRIIVNTHMSQTSLYPSDFQRGFRNGEADIQYLDPSTVVEKKFASNATFVGVNQAVVPRAFKSITGPVYLQRGYSISMRAIEASGLLNTMKRQNQTYSFFVEPDTRLRVDSSLLVKKEMDEDVFFAVKLGEEDVPSEEVTLDVRDLRTLLLNHIGVEAPDFIARKEFIKNMAGNHLIFNNETGEVSGTAPTTNSFRGEEQVPNFPQQISDNADNGISYRINNWFSFSNNSLRIIITSQYPRFHQLLVDADLYDPKEFRYTFVNDSKKYTVFAPSDAAIDSFAFDSLSTEEMQEVLLSHFITGDIIFTDGKISPGYYNTSRVDPRSTEFQRIYTKILIQPEIDAIVIPDRDGGVYARIEEAGANTNNIVTKDISDPEDPPTLQILESFGVVHQIDRILLLEELSTQ